MERERTWEKVGEESVRRRLAESTLQGRSGVEGWVNNQFRWSSMTLELEVGTIQPLRLPVVRLGPLKDKPRVADFFFPFHDKHHSHEE